MADNLQEISYHRIRDGLLSGRFQPGERLKIRDLASEWGTSPMPVRAALLRLVAEGALEGEPQRSVRVPDLDRERFQHILQTRLSLEGMAVELAAERIGPDEIAILRDCLERMQSAIEERQVDTYLQVNSLFHLTLYRACDNPVLLRMIESLLLQVGPLFSRLFTGADMSLRLNEFHQDAFGAIEAGDGKAARVAIEQDLMFFGQFLLSLLDLKKH
ncbi:GntR family transcriptional regulator [Pseudomonas sp. LRF_L74]|uniref:GntR family transcriptional regulator n=1 Tax=Pseudomonas sp. LRF_L74 TaxID=3369422 RepID=UPI003F63A2AA